ncbi:hypothetical protein L593_14385 [Salinarchaeum sp. Harcht-Bsk1]|uniref:hypothetical protein n=1 Tax=Salinarchaeum sp. Harcht-Bsk1 TaxID=1333523 RepID=UPI000342397F|nr:hypothetical protein [Salinarchaeum sp. Harcht-Bsk1]AGN02816.1 hypothetical protein L593_14385 [Salinarchaeum sp. Harcht-Bsk1]
MSDLSPTFGSWRDRLTYLVAEAQLLVAGLLISLGIMVLWFQPKLPGVPGWVYGAIAATLLIGPILFGFFMSFIGWLRTRHWVTVHHINGVTDTREKYKVSPEVWAEKTVEGPSPYRVNDGDAFEVREFDYYDDQDELIVTGAYFSKLADSKLITVQAMLEDIHGQLIETAIAYNKLRGRISRMGVEIERDVVNFQAEADERGLMGRKTAVKERFEAAEEEAQEWDTDEIKDLGDYELDYDPVENPRGEPLEPSDRPAATDGGTDQ